MATKFIRTPIEKIQDINRAVSGIETAPTKYPASLDTARLPLTLVDVGELSARDAADGFNRADIEFTVRCFVDTIAQGEGLDGPKQKCLELLESIVEAYLDDDNVLLSSPTTAVPQSSIQADGDNIVESGGYEVLTYPDGGTKQYHGFTISLRVMSKWSQ